MFLWLALPIRYTYVSHQVWIFLICNLYLHVFSCWNIRHHTSWYQVYSKTALERMETKINLFITHCTMWKDCILIFYTISFSDMYCTFQTLSQMALCTFLLDISRQPEKKKFSHWNACHMHTISHVIRIVKALGEKKITKRIK